MLASAIVLEEATLPEDILHCRVIVIGNSTHWWGGSSGRCVPHPSTGQWYWFFILRWFTWLGRGFLCRFVAPYVGVWLSVAGWDLPRRCILHYAGGRLRLHSA